MKKCQKCGRYTVDADVTCEGCGSDLPEVTPAVAPSPSTARVKNSAKESQQVERSTQSKPLEPVPRSVASSNVSGLTHGSTSLGPEDTIVRAVQFFSTESWKATSQSQRTATFEGRPPIPWLLILGTVIGFMWCIVPGVIMYIMFVQKVYRFNNLVVTANPISGGSEVTIQYPHFAAPLATRFLEALPHQGA